MSITGIVQQFQQFDKDGIEVIINTKTGECFSSQIGLARIAQTPETTVRDYLTSRKITGQEAKIPTATGLKTSRLYDENTILDVCEQFNPSTLKIFAKAGLRIYLHHLAGFEVKSTAIQRPPSPDLQTTTKQLTASLEKLQSEVKQLKAELKTEKAQHQKLKSETPERLRKHFLDRVEKAEFKTAEQLCKEIVPKRKFADSIIRPPLVEEKLLGQYWWEEYAQEHATTGRIYFPDVEEIHLDIRKIYRLD